MAVRIGITSVRQTGTTVTPEGEASALWRVRFQLDGDYFGAVAGLVGIEGGVVSGVFNLESSGVDALDWRPRHDKSYHEA
jgi:hypothetical protein